MVLGVSVTGCGDDGEAGSDALGGGQTRDDRPAATQPAGTDPDAVRPYVDELLVRYDRAVDEILAAPEIVRDDDAQPVEDLRELFDPGTDIVDDLVGLWSDWADEGRRTVPIRDDFPATTTTVDGDLEPVGADEVQVPVCSIRRQQVLDTDDEVVQEVPRVDHPGRATVVRVDGVWHLREVDIVTQAFGCREEAQ